MYGSKGKRVKSLDELPNEPHWVIVTSETRSYQTPGYGDPGEPEYHTESVTQLIYEAYTDIEDLQEDLRKRAESDSKDVKKYKVIHVNPVDVNISVSINVGVRDA